MSATLLQFDFPFEGPWGATMATALQDLARDIAAEDGLVWKIWTENEPERRAGGVYLFSDPQSAERYRRKHEARLAAYGISGISGWSFAVNSSLSRLTRAPL